jgi:ADP-glucose pyrophosphorylase
MYNEDLDYIDTSLDQYPNYEAYLDAHIKDTELFYLEDIELARKLTAVGFQSQGEFLYREEFEAKKKEIEEKIKAKNSNQPKSLASAGCHISDNRFLLELAKREEEVKNGKLSTIIFIRQKKEGSNEVSGYIDLHDRMKTDNFKEYFDGSKKLLPRKTDLSYYNWDTQK